MRLATRWTTVEGWCDLLALVCAHAGEEAAADLRAIRCEHPRDWPVRVYRLLRDVVSMEGRDAAPPVSGIDLRNIAASEIGRELKYRGAVSRALWDREQYVAIRTLPGLNPFGKDPVRAFVCSLAARFR